MRRRFETYKDIPIGIIIKKDLQKKKMSQKALAQRIGMSYKSLNNALNGHRLFSSEEAAKLDDFFEYENCFICNVQNFKKRNSVSAKSSIYSFQILPTPKIRQCVFWDVDMKNIDCIKHHRFIVNRISTYGNQFERKAVEEYYAKIRNTSSLLI